MRPSAKRGNTGEHLIQNSAQRVDVAALAHLSASSLGLLRRHVPGCSQNGARHRGLRGFLLGQLSQSEIGDPGLISRIQEDIGRFEIPVLHTLLVRILDSLGDGLQIAGRPFGLQGLPADRVAKALSLDKLHAEKRCPDYS